VYPRLVLHQRLLPARPSPGEKREGLALSLCTLAHNAPLAMFVRYGVAPHISSQPFCLR